MQSQDWGHATSVPPKVDKSVCSISTTSDSYQGNSSDLERYVEVLPSDVRAIMNQTVNNATGRQYNEFLMPA